MSVIESGSTQPANVDRILSLIRGGCKEVFTRLDQKVDEFRFTAIDFLSELF